MECGELGGSGEEFSQLVAVNWKVFLICTKG